MNSHNPLQRQIILQHRILMLIAAVISSIGVFVLIWAFAYAFNYYIPQKIACESLCKSVNRPNYQVKNNQCLCSENPTPVQQLLIKNPK